MRGFPYLLSIWLLPVVVAVKQSVVVVVVQVDIVLRLLVRTLVVVLRLNQN
jgi:hypothetical protein